MPSQEASAPTPATSSGQDRSLENLVAFTRLLGYVRHFHPSDEAAATNWEAFAVHGMSTVESASSPQDLREALRTLFRPVAPTVRIYITGDPPSLIEPVDDGETRVYIVSWKHVGFGGGIYQQIGYSSERIRTPIAERPSNSNIPDPDQPFVADLGGGVAASVPLAVFSDEQGTLPHSTNVPRFELRTPLDSRTERLAIVALSWNVFQHFYPYFDVVRVDWLAVLRETLAAARTDDDFRFLLTLRRMVAQLQDGHGAVGSAMSATALTTTQNPPWDWIENRLVLTLVKPSDQLRPGDTVLRINGHTALDLIQEEEKYVSASTAQHLRAMAVRYAWAHATDDPMTLEVQGTSGQVTTVTRPRGEICCTKPARLPPIDEVRPAILYLDLSQLTTADFDDAIPQMQRASGIIFDARGYTGRVNASTLGHLTDVPMKWESFCWPLVTYPDHQNISFRVDQPTISPLEPRLKAKIAFLSDVNALSYTESYLAFVEYYRLGEIVGEPTAGMTGGIDPFTLFNQYTFNWTGTKVLKQDGSRHHGVGILPTIPVARTIREIAQGRDEILERAIQVVSP
ncbi:MAG: S41 family peptidase [Chloroflexi bacterium]|nr:S41 family peptidase [Chloroflexota bacterium]